MNASRPRISHVAERRAIVQGCRDMNLQGINQGSAGNLSIRVDAGFLVTPSGVPYDEMQPEDVVEMGFDGTWGTGSGAGEKRPSSEWRFHRDILAARGDVDVVLHAHSTFATVLAVHGRGIPAFHYMVAVAGGSDIRCAPYATFGSQELSDVAVQALEGRHACLLGHHGIIVIGKTIKKALKLAVEVETLARQYVHALTLGDPPILPDDEMERVIEKMRAIGYGPA